MDQYCGVFIREDVNLLVNNSKYLMAYTALLAQQCTATKAEAYKSTVESQLCNHFGSIFRLEFCDPSDLTLITNIAVDESFCLLVVPKYEPYSTEAH